MMADSSSPAHPGLFLPVLLAGLQKRWFIIAVLFVIACANAYPPFGAKSGPLMPEITIKYIAVIAIFFNSGISLKTEELTSAISQVRLHMFIQFYTLVLIPMTVSLLMVPVLQITNFVNPIFLKGLQVVSCMPPPVSSAVILTKSVGGNEAAAIFNSAMGSFLGIVVTPLLLLVFVGTTTTIPFLSIFAKLSITVLFPLILGQVVRQRVKKWLEEVNLPFGIISSLILLTIIYSTFCDTFNESDSHFSIGNTASIGVVVVLTQVSFVGLAFLLSGLFQYFSKQDRIAVIFCATHKSLTLGIPIIKIVFGDSPELSGYSLPLLIYHPTQILLGSVLVPFLQEWIKKDPSTEQITSRSNTPSGKDKTTV